MWCEINIYQLPIYTAPTFSHPPTSSSHPTITPHPHTSHPTHPHTSHTSHPHSSHPTHLTHTPHIPAHPQIQYIHIHDAVNDYHLYYTQSTPPYTYIVTSRIPFLHFTLPPPLPANPYPPLSHFSHTTYTPHILPTPPTLLTHCQPQSHSSHPAHPQSQYIYIHDAINDYINCKDTTIVAHELRPRIEELRQIDITTGSSGFVTQFSVSRQ